MARDQAYCGNDSKHDERDRCGSVAGLQLKARLARTSTTVVMNQDGDDFPEEGG